MFVCEAWLGLKAPAELFCDAVNAEHARRRWELRVWSAFSRFIISWEQEDSCQVGRISVSSRTAAHSLASGILFWSQAGPGGAALLGPVQVNRGNGEIRGG